MSPELYGGKDSTVLWGWAINDSGYDPATIRGSCTDTENEYPEVMAQIKALPAWMPIPAGMCIFSASNEWAKMNMG